MNKKTIVGISGVAQSGKDTFYRLSEKYLYEELGLSCKRYALADYLKDECKDFLKQKFNIDVYSQKIEDKKIFRPFLVWFGDIKRSQTEGQYFTRILEKQILKDDVDVAIITDIRYGEFENDEVQWLKNKLGGYLVHIQRISQGLIIQPPNDNEKRNDPILIKEANYKVRWASDFDPNDKDFDYKMYNKWRFKLEEIYSDILKMKKDIAVEEAKSCKFINELKLWN